MLLCPYVCELSLSLPFLTYSAVQDPGGPASFSTHTHSNVITRVRRKSRRLIEVAPLRAMGGQDYPQFGDRVHANGTYVWIETHHASRADDRLMDDDRLG